MPWVTLAQFNDDKTDIVSADGVKGYLIKRHWTSWVRFWMCAPIVNIVGFGVLFQAKRLGWFPPLASWWSVLSFSAVGAIVYVIVHVDLVWYWGLSRTYILVTKQNVFVSRMQKYFVNVVNAYSLGDATITCDAVSFFFPGIRSVDLHHEGERVVKMEDAAGGNEIERAIETLRGAHS